MSWRRRKFGLAEGIDEVGDEILLLGAGFDGLFFVSDDNLVIGNFDDFFSRDDELGVHETLD